VVDEQLSDRNGSAKETKQERRERRRAREKDRMAQHGKSLVRIYENAVSRRVKVIKARKHSD